MLDIASGNGWVLLAAFLAGAGGGLAAALILLDPSESTTAPPTGAKAWTVVTIRTLVGGVAAVAFLFFFPAEQQTTVTTGGHSVTVTIYPFLKVIALALIVGSGGSAFLSAMRNQANALVTASNANQKTAQVKATSVTALNMLPTIAAEAAKANAAQHAQAIKDVASAELTKTSEALPAQLGITGLDPNGSVRSTFASVTGVDANQLQPADPTVGVTAISDAVDIIPESVEATVANTVQSKVNEVVAKIDAV